MNCFLIGAGFTKALFPEAPLNAELLAALAARGPRSTAHRLKELYDSADIEVALTQLDLDIQSPPMAPRASLEELRGLRKAIVAELAAFFSDFTVTEDLVASTPWLATLLDSGFVAGDVAISLNYDCVLEGALDCRGKWSPRGGYGWVENPLAAEDDTPESPVRVLKIHGSANFTSAPLHGALNARHIGFEFAEQYFPKSAARKNFGIGAGQGGPYVIAPSFVKIPAVEIAYLMLDALQAAARARRLVIIGTGLRPEDAFLRLILANFLHQPDWRERRYVIVDPKADEIAARLASFWGVKVGSQTVPILGALQDSVAKLMAALE